MSSSGEDLHKNIQRFVTPYEEESEKRRSWEIEIEKLIIHQAFTLNWGGLLGTPAFLAINLPKNILASAALGPMWFFAMGLIAAITFAWMTAFTYSTAVKDAEANADLWTHIITEYHKTSSNEFANTDPNSKAQLLKTNAFNVRSKGKLMAFLAGAAGLASFTFFLIGCFRFLCVLQN